jgi:spore coat protein CotF
MLLLCTYFHSFPKNDPFIPGQARKTIPQRNQTSIKGYYLNHNTQQEVLTTMMNLTQKERMLLEDQKKHEEICIEKYTNYANQAQDPQLKSIFQDYAAQEKQHLESINQMLSGRVPEVDQSQQQQQKKQDASSPTKMQGTMANQEDAALCTDMLMTEKYVSGTYDTAIFEFTDPGARQVLNHIQKEEQQHGEGIFNYMQSNGMYNPQ